jgi:hypothetical protein
MSTDYILTKHDLSRRKWRWWILFSSYIYYVPTCSTAYFTYDEKSHLTAYMGNGNEKDQS